MYLRPEARLISWTFIFRWAQTQMPLVTDYWKAMSETQIHRHCPKLNAELPTQDSLPGLLNSFVCSNPTRLTAWLLYSIAIFHKAILKSMSGIDMKQIADGQNPYFH